MTSNTVSRWLLRLSDPENCADLPAARLAFEQIPQLLEQAREHRVAPIVLHHVRRLLDEDGGARLLSRPVDPARRVRLDAIVQTAAQRAFADLALSLLLRSRTRALLPELRQAGIPAAIVKGEDFADRLYPQPGWRPFSDIDLMVPREAIDAAGPVLAGLGYRQVIPGGNFNAEYGERTWEHRASSPATCVELHWNMINCPSQRRRSSLAFSELEWEVTGGSGGPGLRASASSQLLIASVHAVIGHRFDRLLHLCDLRQICRGRSGPLDRAWLRETARRLGLQQAVTGALAVAGRVLHDSHCTTVLHDLQLPTRPGMWGWLIQDDTLLAPERTINRLRRAAVREWMKRAA